MHVIVEIDCGKTCKGWPACSLSQSKSLSVCHAHQENISALDSHIRANKMMSTSGVLEDAA